DSHGEIPVAYVALKAATTPAELRAFCRDRLGPHQVPRRFTVLDALPKNAAGKIVKRELRKQGELERGVDLPG
ncbi:MAG: long-chain fatty acid--CoA ligase, partial [Gammaproteobacteria bacterium]|nr:long-chain fatty acid--CoA ligase [Gammaproteobacteria bacterium]